MAFGIAFENGIRYDGRTGGESHKPRTDRMEKEFKLETAPYSGMAENGMICYKGVVFTCDTENNRICLGDTTDLKKCINIPLAGGGSLLVNRDNLDELSRAIGMFSPEDVNKIMAAIETDNMADKMKNQVEDEKANGVQGAETAEEH